MLLPFMLTFGIALAACGSQEPRGQDGTAAPGSAENGPGGAGDAAQPADDQRRQTLASLTLDDGRVIELRAKGKPPYEGVSPCLMVIGIDEDIRQCGTAPSIFQPPKADRAILADAYAQSNHSAPLEVYGSTQPEVGRVVLTYSVDGASKRLSAQLLKATDEALLRQAQIGEPFGYFFAELPTDTSVWSVRAEALTSGGGLLGTAAFDAVHPQNGGSRAFIAGP